MNRMADEKPLPSGDNTPTASKQQLVQSTLQFLIAFCTGMLPILAGDGEITARKVLWVACGAALAALGVFAASFIQLPETRRKA